MGVFRLPGLEHRPMLQRKRRVPFRSAAYVGGGIKMRPSLLDFSFPNALKLISVAAHVWQRIIATAFVLGPGMSAKEAIRMDLRRVLHKPSIGNSINSK